MNLKMAPFELKGLPELTGLFRPSDGPPASKSSHIELSSDDSGNEFEDLPYYCRVESHDLTKHVYAELNFCAAAVPSFI